MNIFKKAFCRTYQFAFHLALPVLPYREPKILKEVKQIPKLLQQKKIRRVLLVTDAGVRGLGLTNRLELGLKEAGIQLGYHNHDFEFEKFPGCKKTMMEIFYEETDPECVCAEIDVHWVTRGGGSPVYWIHKVAGRMPVVHFKDFVRYEGEPRFCEIGEGNLDWAAIIEACRATNVRWYSIEQDQPFPGRDIFESVKISFDNLRAMGVK